MATGMAAATLAQTAAALGIAPAAATLAMPSSEVANSGALLAATALLTFLGLARTAQAVGVPLCRLCLWHVCMIAASCLALRSMACWDTHLGALLQHVTDPSQQRSIADWACAAVGAPTVCLCVCHACHHR